MTKLKSIGSRMKTTLAAAGLAHDPASSGTESGGPAVMSAMRESAFAKQAAAIEQQTRRFEAAVRQSDAGFSKGGKGKGYQKGGYDNYNSGKGRTGGYFPYRGGKARMGSSRKAGTRAATKIVAVRGRPSR